MTLLPDKKEVIPKVFSEFEAVYPFKVLKEFQSSVSYKALNELKNQSSNKINFVYFDFFANFTEYDNNDCSDGKIAGALLGGGAGAAMSRGDGRWWAIPLGAVVGGTIGCDLDGG